MFGHSAITRCDLVARCMHAWLLIHSYPKTLCVWFSREKKFVSKAAILTIESCPNIVLKVYLQWLYIVRENGSLQN